MPALITLTTDYGSTDHYVATMKGVIAAIAPSVQTIDVSHAVTPQDVMEAGWMLRQSVPYFPEGTIHLAVVDPGVGTARRAIACRMAGHVFIGPDNGLFSLLLGDDALGVEHPDVLVELDRPEFWRNSNPSSTFHGRDIFASVAAHIASGRSLEEVGTPLSPDSMVRLRWVLPLADSQGLQGWIVHIDHYGNAITNIPGQLIESFRKKRDIRCYAGAAIIDGISETYAEVEPGEPLAVIGSSGHLEVCVNRGNAADLLSLHRGSAINLVFSDRR